MSDPPAHLAMGPRWPASRRRELARFVSALAADDSRAASHSKAVLLTSRSPSLLAAVHLVDDLAEQGWSLQIHDGQIVAQPPEPAKDPLEEKARIQRQEHLKRDEQLRLPSVCRFIEAMEQPRLFNGQFVSIFQLMRDGRDLAQRLHQHMAEGRSTTELRALVEPYVQVVAPGQRCPFTGLRLLDVWRYFRYTWANQYTSTPGRTLMLLVRDAAAPYHPVIGIAALGSAVVQIRERDEWIGWDPDTLLRAGTLSASQLTQWLTARLEHTRSELYVEDLLRDGLYWPTLWMNPNRAAIDALRHESRMRRQRHTRFARRSHFRWNRNEADSWQARAETDLFRSKRCLLLADLLEARLVLAPLLAPHGTTLDVDRELSKPRARRAITAQIRRAKADAVGTEIADLTVCGAVPPYSALLGGKLVSVLAVSPTVVRAYERRYRAYPSEIASSLAGRGVSRRSNLAFVGTTSLYGSGSSQYNRLRVPQGVVGNVQPISFTRLGRSRSFGTSHLSQRSIAALARVCETAHDGVRVNSIFGEGVNPKLRKVRQGLDLIGWPSEELLQHRRERLVYGVTLVDNLLPYLLGIEGRPKYLFDTQLSDDVERLGEWWRERWLSKRISYPGVLANVACHTVDRPVQHGARVARPTERDDL